MSVDISVTGPKEEVLVVIHTLISRAASTGEILAEETSPGRLVVDVTDYQVLRVTGWSKP